MNAFLVWLANLTGADNTTGVWYGFWSGFGSDLGEIAILGALISLYRKHNCHVRHCWRIARHDVAGTQWKTCRKHHPHSYPRRSKPTRAEIIADHEKAMTEKGHIEDVRKGLEEELGHRREGD